MMNTEEVKELIRRYVDEKQSIPDISLTTHIPRSTIRYWLKKYGVLRSVKEAVTLAGPKISKANKGRKTVFSSEARENMRNAALKRHNKTAKGISLKPSGYYEITRGRHKGRPLHNVIMELHLGRRLRGDEVVHHTNQDKTDNRVENLQVMTRSEYQRLHIKERIKNGEVYDISQHSGKGEKHPHSKLTESQVVEILKSDKTHRQLAIDYNVKKGCITKIKTRRSWKHVKT